MDNSKPVVMQMALAKLMEAEHKGMSVVRKGFCGEWVLAGVGEMKERVRVYEIVKQQILFIFLKLKNKTNR